MSLSLSVDGRVYEGWIQARIERSLDAFAHRFSLTYLDRWASNQEPWTILAGAECVLKWKAETLITGYVNAPRFQASGEDWTLTASGRSKTGDLVDCSAVHETGMWRQRTALQIAQDLCAPYGIDVSSNALPSEPFNRFALREGESVHAAIDRVCKIRALLPRTDTAGNVELFTSDAAPGPVRELPVDTAIVRTYADDDSMRHSQYLTRATNVGDAEDALARAVALDSGIKRFRPLVVVGDAPAGTDAAELRAIWEANVRYGRGERLTYVLPAVEAPSSAPSLPGLPPAVGQSYQPGQRFRVRDQLFGVDLVMLVASATIEVSQGQLQTTVELVRPQSYSRFEFDAKKLTKKTKKPRQTVRPNL